MQNLIQAVMQKWKGDQSRQGSNRDVLLLSASNLIAMLLVGCTGSGSGSEGDANNQAPAVEEVANHRFFEDSVSSINIIASDDRTKSVDLIYKITEHSDINAIISGSTIDFSAKNNFNGSETFTLTVEDASGLQSTATFIVTVEPVNDVSIGAVSIIGTAKTGETLTAFNTLEDHDGLGTIRYQWAKDGAAVSGATEVTLVLDDDDIGSVFTVTASYTDDGGTVESETSIATSAVTDIDKAFMFTSEVIAASEAPDGLYALDSSEKIIKLTLNVDMARISDHIEVSAGSFVIGTEYTIASVGTTDYTSIGASANTVGAAFTATAAGSGTGTVETDITSILGGVLDFRLDWNKIEAMKYNDGVSEPYISAARTLTDLDSSTTFSKFFALSHSESTADQFDTVTITSLHVAGNSPFLTLVDDTDTTARNFVDHSSENDVADIYLNPIDSITSLDITFGGLVIPNQGDYKGNDIIQLDYTTTVTVDDLMG
jgi:hypothetical protein